MAGYIYLKFCTNIKIKVNSSVKEAATEKELALVLLLLNKSTMGLRLILYLNIIIVIDLINNFLKKDSLNSVELMGV